MNIDRNINTAVNVAARITKLRLSAKKAADSISRLCFDAFGDTFTEKEKEIIKAAQVIAERVSSECTEHDILKYLTTLEP